MAVSFCQMRMTATQKTPKFPAAPNSSGRPLTLTEVSADLLANLREGMTLQEAAESVGISYRTLRRWVKTGEDELQRVEENPKSKLKKALKTYTDFATQYRQARMERRKTLYQSSTLVALGGYIIKERRVTEVHKNGQLINLIEINKEKEVGPDGQLALKLLQYDDTLNKSAGDGEGDEPTENSPLNDLFSQISKMSPDELETLAENLEAAL